MYRTQNVEMEMPMAWGYVPDGYYTVQPTSKFNESTHKSDGGAMCSRSTLPVSTASFQGVYPPLMYPQPQFDVDSSRTVILDSGPPSIPTHSSEQPVRHEWTETSNAAISKAIDLLVIEVPDGGAKRFFCGWRECSHTSGFARKAQLLTHIRTVHFSEKPFVCTTCDASFTRRQDASRHVDTMNRGTQYECFFCEEGFARKDYRDRHAKRCRSRLTGTHSNGREASRASIPFDGATAY